MLFSRELQNIKRDKTVLLARVVLTIVIALFAGFVFFQVGEADSTEYFFLHSQFGAVTTLCAVMMILTSQTALMVFPAERPVFLREYTTDHYSVASYFTSRLALESVVTSILCLTLVSVYDPCLGQLYSHCRIVTTFF